MPGNLPVPQGVEVKIVWTLSGQDAAVNILHFRHPVGTVHSQARADTLATAVRTQFTSQGFAPNIAPVVALARVESRHMDSNTDPWYIGAGAAVPGTGTGDPLPPGTSFCVTLRTGLRGRSYNGRVYLWGFTEATNDSAGNCTSAAAGGAVGFVSGVNAALASQLQLTAALLSRWTTPPGSAPGTPPTERNPPILTDVTLATNRDLRWDYQRRRSVAGI